MEVDTKLEFVMAGTTKQDSDCKDALDRIARIAHAGSYGRRELVVLEGDEETYSFMVNLKRSEPNRYGWMLPVPGAWHLMFHASKALVERYYAVGLESVCKVLGADDNHVLAGTKFRRNDHFLMVMFEGLWLGVVEKYMQAQDPSGGVLEPKDVEDKVVPWLRQQSEGHQTLMTGLQETFRDYNSF